MQTLGELSGEDFTARLYAGDLALRIGPYNYSIQSNLPEVAAGIRTLYRDFVLAQKGDFIDYGVGIRHGNLWQQLKGEVEFLFDWTRPFDRVPTSQAYAFLEWGMNWCISLHANEYLKLHAAAVSRNNATVILPGTPGSGKSTLCAALGLRGWRILSDEHAMLEPGTTRVIPLCRPVSLKNESIEVIRDFSPRARFGPVSKETHKGRVSHMKADLHPRSHDRNCPHARWMVFPRYSNDLPQGLTAKRRADSFVLAAYHSFNYSLLGEAGFNAMSALINAVDCYDLVYNDIEWAVQTLDQLTEAQATA